MIEVETVDALLAEIDMLGGRAYPEIGVPAFLIAEGGAGEGAVPPSPSAHDELAAALERLAAAVAIRRPVLDAGMIAQLLELLADRHFLGPSPLPFSRTATLHPAPAA